jgi:ABC-type uncharacterized transport system permease subunit
MEIAASQSDAHRPPGSHDVTDLAPLLEAAVRTATPLLIASVGETVSERAGVINIGLEGCIVAGAYAAFAVGTVTPTAGY